MTDCETDAGTCTRCGHDHLRRSASPAVRIDLCPLCECFHFVPAAVAECPWCARGFSLHFGVEHHLANGESHRCLQPPVDEPPLCDWCDVCRGTYPIDGTVSTDCQAVQQQESCPNPHCDAGLIRGTAIGCAICKRPVVRAKRPGGAA